MLVEPFLSFISALPRGAARRTGDVRPESWQRACISSHFLLKVKLHISEVLLVVEAYAMK